MIRAFRYLSFLFLLVFGLFTNLVHAAGPDFSSLTGAVDFGSVVTAVLAIASAIAGVFVAVRGAKLVLGMIRGR